MNKLNVIIETTVNNLSAYIEDIDGIIAVGQNLSKLKQSMNESVEVYVKTCKDYGYDIPEQLQGEYEFVFKYDLRSFLNAYGAILSKAGLERITGVHQKQLWHYASGKSKPKESTVRRIAESVHNFAKELQGIELT